MDYKSWVNQGNSFLDTAAHMTHNNCDKHTQDLPELKGDRIPVESGEGGHGIPFLAEELLGEGE